DADEPVYLQHRVYLQPVRLWQRDGGCAADRNRSHHHAYPFRPQSCQTLALTFCRQARKEQRTAAGPGRPSRRSSIMKSRRIRISSIVLKVFLAVLIVVEIYPILWILTSSLTPQSEFVT